MQSVERGVAWACNTARCRTALAAALLLAAAPLALSEPLELRSGAEVGAGTGFRRGDICLVLTAAHVVASEGQIEVKDRTGGRGTGKVTYVNTDYDVALVELDPGFANACTDRWPEPAWMAAARWTTSTVLDARRHYPDGGRETNIQLRWTGGTNDTLTLEPTGKTGIRGSDSGALVYQGERLVGMVRAVDTGTNLVDVLRIDVIDRLLGERFRGLMTAATNLITFDGVFSNGRPHANWTNYIGAWLSEGAGKTLVDAGNPQSRCRVRSDVFDWSQRVVANPRYADLQQSLGSCKTNPLFRRSTNAVKFCEDGIRSQLNNTPRQLRVHVLQVKVDVAPRDGQPVNRLRTVEIAEDAAANLSRSQMELQVLQSAFRTVASDLLNEACN
jgi:hypothetical protein